MQEVIFEDLGVIDYKSAWDYQEAILKRQLMLKAEKREKEVQSGISTDSFLDTQHYFLLCEHPPVYTLGKSGHPENILVSKDDLLKRGIEVYRTNRGGDITYHGPGQIVGYPILDLEKFYTDIGKYIHNLEEVIIRTLEFYGIKSERSKGETGVWIEPLSKGKERKICAIGVRCSRWITMHGFALNVNTNLSYFNDIVPCGITNKQVTSMERELGYNPGISMVKETLKACFEEVFNCTLKSGTQINI